MMTQSHVCIWSEVSVSSQFKELNRKPLFTLITLQPLLRTLKLLILLVAYFGLLFSSSSFSCCYFYSSPYTYWIFILCELMKQGSWQPSSDLHSCPQSAEYDCSPQAKEQARGLYIFSLFNRFPRGLKIGQENANLGKRMPVHQLSPPHFPLRLSFSLISMSPKSSVNFKLFSFFFPEARHSFGKAMSYRNTVSFIK